ncbi:hypothetical protein FRC03_008121 [Tulasnella sp. 419]|nr:hypothetical protein FRC03_008121 [Tulasnella sp. 419]
MPKAPKDKRKQQTQGLVNTCPPPTSGGRKKKGSWICPCGCGRYIKDKRTELRHLEGIGPSYVRVVHALKSSGTSESAESQVGPQPSPQLATPSEHEPTISPPSSPLATMIPASPNADFSDDNDILGPANNTESHDQDELEDANTPNTDTNTKQLPSIQRMEQMKEILREWIRTRWWRMLIQNGSERRSLLRLK